MNSFPKEVQRPTIIKASTSDLPVFYININEEYDSERNSWNSVNLPMPY
ncbi:MAG: hypothetical protein ACLUPL_03475 [Butyricimonas virosa]